MHISKIDIDGFKPFSEEEEIELTGLNIFFGANSCGKSSVIQSLLLLKQTLSCRVDQIDVLINGKYINLGTAEAVINKDVKTQFSVGIKLTPYDREGLANENESDKFFKWTFEKSDKRINRLQLKEFELEADSIKKYLQLEEMNKSYFFEENNTEKAFKVEKLLPSSVEYVYDNRYSTVANNFYFDLFKLSGENEKKFVWPLHVDFDLNQNKIFKVFFEALGKIDKNVENTVIEDEATLGEILKQFELISDSINRKLQLHHDSSTLIEMRAVFTQYILMITRYREVELIKLKDLLDDYMERLEQISRDSSNGEFESRIFNIRTYFGDKDEELQAFNMANDDIYRCFANMQYLGPIRERPRNMYEYQADENPLYVGKHGQFLPGVLAYNKEREIDVLLPNKSEKNSCSLIYALNKWLKYMGIADSVDATFGDVLSVDIIKNDVRSSISNVGVGVSQVLPAIVMGLLSTNKQVLVFEQPELHLHPFIQGKLIDFFISLVKSGRQIIIESHSEYFLHRLRYQILNKEIDKENVKVLFFDNSVFGTQIHEATFGEYGEFDYPEDFNDASQELLKELLKSQIGKQADE